MHSVVNENTLFSFRVIRWDDEFSIWWGFNSVLIWPRNPKLCLMEFRKMSGLELCQIFKRIFHTKNSCKFDYALVIDSSPCHFTSLFCRAYSCF